jgi:pilus assembly protein CpaB
MRSVFALVLVLGVGLAGFAVYMAKGYIGDYQQALAAERAARGAIVPTVQVYVTKDKLKYGDQVTAENVRAVRWPQDAIPEGAFTKLEDLFPQGEKPFRTVLRTMEKDEAVLKVKVTQPGQDAGVSARLSSGMRAFAIKVDATSGVSGFLAPGDRVDVYWTGRIGAAREGAAQNVTKLIQSGVQVVAIDQSADLDRTSPTLARTITVAVSPEQVASLAQAQATGRLSLSLVGQGDETVASGVEVNQNQLLGIKNEVTAAPVAPKKCTVRTRRGADIVETEIPCPTDGN